MECVQEQVIEALRLVSKGTDFGAALKKPFRTSRTVKVRFYPPRCLHFVNTHLVPSVAEVGWQFNFQQLAWMENGSIER